VFCIVALAACDATNRRGDLDAFVGQEVDLAGRNGAMDFSNGVVDLATGMRDLATGSRDMATGSRDLSTGSRDLSTAGTPDMAHGTTGIVTGGPCSSGAVGGTAIRVHYTNAGGTAQVNYDAFGLPDNSREKVSMYGYAIGFTSTFDDYFLGPGGVVLDDTDFIDIELSTVGISTINSATLSILGRSFATTTDGSFSWQSFVDTGATATDFVSNVAPYSWYSADLGGAIDAGNNGVLLRVKAGPSSDSLIVNTLEICINAS
jgi:hypothetical protein